MAAITELELSVCHSSSMSDRISAVPGLKTSTAFFTFLRANLVLPPSAMSSNVNTPLLEPTTPHAPDQLPPSSSAGTRRGPAGGNGNSADDDDIPPLSLEILTARPDKVAALKLVADSVAQQRQLASSSLVFHPVCLAALAAALALAHRLVWAPRGRDVGLGMIVLSGLLMTYLLAIRYATAPYLRRAEQLSWDFLVAPGGEEEDTVIGTRFGGEIIGALVLRLEATESASSPTSSPRRKTRSGGGGASSLKRSGGGGGRGVIRAWTTRLRYRGRGVGADMLEEAVRVTRERCGRDAAVGFAREHANGAAVLPEVFNGVFRRGERRAAKALEKVLAGWEGSHHHRRKW